MKKLVVTGGTAGHVFPAIAHTKRINGDLCIAESSLRFCKNHQPRLIFYSYRSIWNVLKNVLFLFAALSEYDELHLFGSYHCAFALIIGILQRKVIRIYEQNSIIGKLNYVGSFFATSVSSAFRILNINNYLYEGMPQNLPIHIPETKKHIVIFSGSGSSNQLTPFLDTIYNFSQIHGYVLYGSFSDFSILQDKYPCAHFSKYFDNWEELLGSCALFLGHSGASTISYLHLYNRSAILIPLTKSSENHQTYNAIFSGYPHILSSDTEFVNRELKALLYRFLSHPEYFLPRDEFFKNNIPTC